MQVLRLQTDQAGKVATFEVPVFATLNSTVLLLRLPAALDRKVLQLRRQRGCSPVTIMDDHLQRLVEDANRDNDDAHFVMLRLLPRHEYLVEIINHLRTQYPDRWGHPLLQYTQWLLASAHSTAAAAELSCCTRDAATLMGQLSRGACAGCVGCCPVPARVLIAVLARVPQHPPHIIPLPASARLCRPSSVTPHRVMVRLVTQLPRVSLVHAVVGLGVYPAERAFRLHEVVQIPSDMGKALPVAVHTLLSGNPCLPAGFAAEGEPLCQCQQQCRQHRRHECWWQGAAVRHPRCRGRRSRGGDPCSTHCTGCSASSRHQAARSALPRAGL